MATATKLPPLSGSPFHHSPLSTKLPLLMDPSGAARSHVNSYRPMPFNGSKASVAIAPGARLGKSNNDVGVPSEKEESGFRFVETNQSASLRFVIEYPQ